MNHSSTKVSKKQIAISILSDVYTSFAIIVDLPVTLPAYLPVLPPHHFHIAFHIFTFATTDGVQEQRRVEAIQRRLQQAIVYMFERSHRHISSTAASSESPSANFRQLSLSPPETPELPSVPGGGVGDDPRCRRRSARLAFARLTGALTELRIMYDAFSRFGEQQSRSEEMRHSRSSAVPTASSSDSGATPAGQAPDVSTVAGSRGGGGANLSSFWEAFSRW